MNSDTWIIVLSLVLGFVLITAHNVAAVRMDKIESRLDAVENVCGVAI